MREFGNLPDGLIQRQRSWIQAVNQTDLVAYADLVSEDVVWLPPGQTSIEGRKAFETWLAPFLERYSYEFSIDEPSFRMADDWALEKGGFRSLMTSRSGGEAMEHRGRFIVLWRRDDDAQWRIDRYVDDTPAEEIER